MTMMMTMSGMTDLDYSPVAFVSVKYNMINNDFFLNNLP